jgi:hypothetical protein
VRKVIVEIDLEAAKPSLGTNQRDVIAWALNRVVDQINRRGVCPDGKWGGEVVVGTRTDVVFWTCHTG